MDEIVEVDRLFKRHPTITKVPPLRNEPTEIHLNERVAPDTLPFQPTLPAQPTLPTQPTLPARPVQTTQGTQPIESTQTRQTTQMHPADAGPSMPTGEAIVEQPWAPQGTSPQGDAATRAHMDSELENGGQMRQVAIETQQPAEQPAEDDTQSIDYATR